MISYIELSMKMIGLSLGTRSWSAVWVLSFFCDINHFLSQLLWIDRINKTYLHQKTQAGTTKENRILRWIRTSINNKTNWYSKVSHWRPCQYLKQLIFMFTNWSLLQNGIYPIREAHLSRTPKAWLSFVLRYLQQAQFFSVTTVDSSCSASAQHMETDK